MDPFDRPVAAPNIDPLAGSVVEPAVAFKKDATFPDGPPKLKLSPGWGVSLLAGAQK